MLALLEAVLSPNVHACACVCVCTCTCPGLEQRRTPQAPREAVALNQRVLRGRGGVEGAILPEVHGGRVGGVGQDRGESEGGVRVEDTTLPTIKACIT